MTPPAELLRLPIAHRALHDATRPENSRAAIRAAVKAGYAIEIDLQPSADGRAMVFHDETLDRLTGARGPVATRSAAELGQITLPDVSTIPSLDEVLTIIAGRVPLLIELKDQTGQPGPPPGSLEKATAQALATYHGPVAVMSFNPQMMARMARLAPDIARGLTTCAFSDTDFPDLPATLRNDLASIAAFEDVGACFISHDHTDLTNPAVRALAARGVPVLCWTITSPEQARTAQMHADNITFEQYLPTLP